MKTGWRITGWIVIALCAAQATISAQDTGRPPSLLSATSAEDVALAEPELGDRFAWLQQPGRPPAFGGAQPATQPPPTTARSTQFGSLRLASAPNMFGDLGGQVVTTTTVRTINANGQTIDTITQNSANVPLGGGGTRVGKISENDSPIPRDRFFFSYNHFQNVFELRQQRTAPPGPPLIRQQPIDRYTVGGEKTFFDGWTSVEIRMPMQGTLDAQLPNIGVNAGNVGNLTVVAKSLLLMDDATTAIGAGVAVETPTGSDTFTRLGTTNLRFLNQAVHLLPYIGFVWSPDDPRWGWGDGLFITGFAQIDFAANGNTVNSLGQAGTVAGNLGRFNEQNLGFLDLGAGYWLYRNPYAPRITGLAVVSELHYTTTLQDPDRIVGTVGGSPLTITNPSNRFDVLNGTIGVQGLLFDRSALRVAGVFPIGNEDRRLFDSEVQVQFNRRF